MIISEEGNGVQKCVIAFFFNDTATTEIYTLSLHDALPISKAIRVKIVKPTEIAKKVPKTAPITEANPLTPQAQGTIDSSIPGP